MTDIVERLNDSLSAGYSELRKEAAVEIMRLRAKITEMERQEPIGWLLAGDFYEVRQMSLYKDNEPIQGQTALYALPGAQPTPSFADAYQGAMEEVAIWKKRALEAEDLNRKFVAEINGPTYMGDPAQPAPSVPDGWLRAIDEALVTAHIGGANAHDTYEQAKAKLDNLIGFLVDVATDPAVNGGYKLMPIEPTKEIYECFAAYDGTAYSNPFDFDDFKEEYKSAIAAAPEVKL